MPNDAIRIVDLTGRINIKMTSSKWKEEKQTRTSD